jgi:signal transduction histidine kinase
MYLHGMAGDCMNGAYTDERTVDDILITGELARRPPRAPDYATECAAWTVLARQLAADPRRLLQKVAECVADLCHADSAGVVLRGSGSADSPGISATFGPLAASRCEFAACRDSLWATVMQRNVVMLFAEPAHHFADLCNIEPPIHEALVVPCELNGMVVGVVFAISQRAEKRFDAQDARLLRDMVPYVVAAWRMNGAQDDASSSRETGRNKDEFLMTLAHELRNPLASICNVVEVLRASVASEAPVRAVDVLDRQAHHAVRLVDDLLDVSRIARGKVDLNRQPMVLADAVRSAVEACLPLFEQNGQTLSVSLPDAPVVLNADPVRLTQVLTNLLHNAAKYSGAGARTWLTVSRGERADIVISVRDTGAGIPAEQLRHVFDMFAQAHGNTPGGKRGLGIGLTMVRRLVELHGGCVEARSAGAGLGSEFVVRLPVD